MGFPDFLIEHFCFFLGDGELLGEELDFKVEFVFVLHVFLELDFDFIVEFVHFEGLKFFLAKKPLLLVLEQEDLLFDYLFVPVLL